ncbi:MAG: hypothetical protein GY859_42120, partial [Desulfobacterales bacterium]|nr:hypothetical protein [Desulfobacterales bacterium]
MNGDGYDDILLGVSANNAGGSDAGQTYLIFGRANGWAIDTNLSRADVSFIGEAADDLSGRFATSAGDVNNDGRDDILIGAPKNDAGGSDAGQTYLFLSDYVPETCELTMFSTDGGSVADPGEGIFTHECGAVVNLVAAPAACHEFVSWTGRVADPDSPVTTVTMSVGKNVTANFRRITHNLTTASSDGGSVTEPGEGTSPHACGAVVNLVAAPDACHEFVIWTGDAADPGSSTTTVTMDAAKSVSASFQRITYNLTTASTGGGSVTEPGEGTSPHACGAVVNLVATPDACHEFVNWTGDVADPDSPTTTVSMDAAKSVTANFQRITYNLTSASTDGGSVTEPGEGTSPHACGAVVNLVAAPAACHEFVNWTGDVANSDSPATTVTMDAAKSVTANFQRITHDLTTTSSDGGSVTDPGEGTSPHACGDVVPLVAVPDACNEFVNWIGEVADLDSPVTTVTMDASKSVTANFQRITYSLTTASTDGGSVTEPGEGTAPHACRDVVDLTAAPDHDRWFINWTGDVADPDSPATTVTMDAAKSVTANFSPEIAIGFSTGTWQTDETNGVAVISVSLSSPGMGPITVDYATSEGTATAGEDYTGVEGVLTFQPGETVQTFDIPIWGDDDQEGDETILLALSNPDHAVLGETHAAALTIRDDEGVWRISAIDSTGDWNRGMSIALDQNGAPGISYEAFDAVYGGVVKYAKNGGNEWTTETVKVLENVTYETSLKFDSASRPQITFMDYHDYKNYFAEWDGEAWLFHGFSGLPVAGDLEIDGSDIAHIAWYRGSNLEYRRWDGVAWEATTVDDSGDVGYWAELVLDDEGRKYISYAQWGHSLKFAHFDGADWSTEFIDSSSLDANLTHPIVLNSQNTPIVLYADSDKSILLASRIEGQWQFEATPLIWTIGTHVGFVIDESDRIHIACIQEDAGMHYLKYFLYGGGSWEVQVVDQFDNSVAQRFDVDLALAPDGAVHIAYTDPENGDLKYAVYKTGGCDYPPDAQITSVSPSPANPFSDTVQFRENSFDGDEGGASIVAWEWRSDLGDWQGETVLSTLQLPDIPADDLTVGLHEITLQVEDDEGCVSETSAALLVENVPPLIDSILSTPESVLEGSGTPIQVLASARDMDEHGQSIEEWRVDVFGQPGVFYHTSKGPGDLNVLIPTDGLAPGLYNISLMARDDEGSWTTSDDLVFTITPFPPPSVGFSSSAYSADENGGAAAIAVSLSNASPRSISVNYSASDGSATDGEDYTIASGVVTFAPGEMGKVVNVTILDDNRIEGDETIDLTLSDPTNAVLADPSTAILTIVDVTP